MEDSDCNSSYAENESSECDSSDGDSDSEGFSDSQAEETDGSDVDATTSEDEVDEDEREEYSSANMRRRIKRLEEDEEEADDDDDSPVKRPQGKKSKSRMILSSDEEEEGGAGAGGVSSGDDAGQTCTICLLKFESQELGFPSSCSHVFCADCITEWTANVPTCPIDRKSIRRIVIKRGLGGDTVREVRVEKRRADEIEAALWNRDEGEPLYDFDVMCETCGAGDRSETLLLCDGCDLGFHLECLVPPLSAIPRTRYWYCPTCSAAGIGAAATAAVSRTANRPPDVTSPPARREITRRRRGSESSSRRNRTRNGRRTADGGDPQENGDDFIDDAEEEDGDLSFIVPDDEEENSEEDFDCLDVGEFAPRTILSERIERSIRQRRRRTAGTDRPAAAASSSSATRKTKKRKKTPAKRKTKKKRATTARKKRATSKAKTKTASGGAKSTTTPKKRRRRKRKTKGKGKGKGKGKSSAKSATSEERQKKESGPSLSLFGSKYDVDFHGDVEENDRLYPAPSTSFGATRGGLSNNHVAREVASSSSSSSSSNMLSSILTSQRATLTTGNSSGRGEKMKEVYARPRGEEEISSAGTQATGMKRSWSAANSSSCSSEDSCKENSAKRSNISVRPAQYLFSSPTRSTSSDNIMSSAEKPDSKNGPSSSSSSSSSSIKMLVPDVSPFRKERAVVQRGTTANSPKPNPCLLQSSRSIDMAESPAKSPIHRPRQLVQTPPPPPPSRPRSPPSKSAESAPDPKRRLDEITAAVKPFLRPYFKDGKISKDAYKDVLGKAVKDLYREFGKEGGKIPTAKACDIVQKHVNAVRQPREVPPKASTSSSSSTSRTSSNALSKSQEAKAAGTRLEEITDAVKPFLRPYYKDGKIDRDAYKEILSRAVKSLYQEFGKENGKIPTSRACDTVQRLFKRNAP